MFSLHRTVQYSANYSPYIYLVIGPAPTEDAAGGSQPQPQQGHPTPAAKFAASNIGLSPFKSPSKQPKGGSKKAGALEKGKGKASG